MEPMKRVAIALLLVGSVASFAAGETKAEKTAKLAVTVPDGWKLDVKDAGLTGESKDKDIALLAWPVDAMDAAAAEKRLDGELYRAVANIKWDKPTTGKAHGLPATYVSGTGHAVGGDVIVKAAVIGPGKAKKSLLVALAVKVDKLDAHKVEIQTVLDSVQAGK
jgi:hypothetical protein